MSYLQDQAAVFAGFVKHLGFTVYLAESGTYGFITDDAESRVLSFSMNGCGSLSGNYGPPSRESGTGWRLDKDPSGLRNAQDIREALYATPSPHQCGSGWKYFTTVKQYLAAYGSSSKFIKL